MEWVSKNMTKVLGVLVSIQGWLTVTIAAGGFKGLMQEHTILWLGLGASLLGAIIIGLGYKNSTAEKVADAKVEVASAMKTAINASPGDIGRAR